MSDYEVTLTAKACELAHGLPHNSSEVYGHPGTDRTCTRSGSLWFYDATPNALPWLLVPVKDANWLDYVTAEQAMRSPDVAAAGRPKETAT